MSFPFALATLLGRSTARPKVTRVRRALGTESLEDRRLLTITVTFQTSLGNFDVELYDQQAPLTVQNFLNYARDNDYDGAIFHRSVPGFIVQGGGFETDLSSIPQDPAVQNEPGISNTRGTIAMAKLGGNPNSATNQWFFNLADNSQNLDNQNGGFTVFGKVLGNGMQVVDAIAALQTINRGGAFTNLPVRNYSGSAAPTPEQLVVVTDIVVQGSTIEGSVFHDQNNNAVRDGAEAGVSGWTVYLDADNDGVQDSGESTAQTDSTGAYRFSGVQAGTYVVRSVQRTGWARTSPASGFYSVTLAQGENATGRDFGQVSLTAPTGLDLLDASDTGSSVTDNLTRLNNENAAGALTFQLSGLLPGAKVELYSGSIKIGELTATGTTATIVTAGGVKLADGVNHITASQTLGGVAGPASAILTLTIDAKAPVISSTAGTLAAVGSAYSYDAASDEDSGNPGYSLAAAPTGMTINASTGLVSWTPAAGQDGAQAYTVRVTDAAGNSKDQVVNLTVRPPNSAPVGGADNYSLDEDQVLEIPVAQGVLVNDSDEDEDPITAVLVAGPAHGTLALAANGSFKYTPNANYNGVDTFTYRVSDGVSTSDPITVTFTIAALPDVPTGAADSYNVNEDATLDPAAAAGVLANDSNPDGVTVEALLESGPAHGEFTFRPDGSFTYSPADNYHGPDSFTYRLKFGDQQTEPITVSLTVVSVNDPPIAGNDQYSLDEDETLTVAVGNGLLENDSDPVEQSPLTAVLVSGPQHGTLQLQPNGSFTYTPNANYNGTDSFTYRAHDGSGGSEVATVTLTISPLPDNPVAQPDTYDVAEDDELVIGYSVGEDGELVVDAANGVLKNDSDPDGGALTAVQLSDPSSGQLSFNPDGSFKYVPVANFTGTVQFTYKVTAGTRESTPVAVTINVTAVNDAPIARPDTYAFDEDTIVSTAAFDGVLGNDSDIDTTVISTVLVRGPSHGTLRLNLDGSFSYVPAANFFGTDTFTYRATDGAAQSDEVTVTLVVQPVEDPLGVAPVDDQLSLAGSSIAFQIVATDPDSPNQLFLYALGAGAPDGASIDAQTGAVTWLVPADASGDFDIPVIVTSGDRVAEQVVRVSVLNLGGVAFPTAQLLSNVADVVPAPQPAVNQQLLAASLLELEYDPIPVVELDTVAEASPLDRVQSGDYVVENGELPDDLRPDPGAGGRRRVQRPATPPQTPAKGASLPQQTSAGIQGKRPADLRLPVDSAGLAAMLRAIEAAANVVATVADPSAAEAPTPAAVGENAPAEAAVSTAALPLALAALASTEAADKDAGENKDRRASSRRGRIDQGRTSLGRWCRIE